jgi:hypothetical protein
MHVGESSVNGDIEKMKSSIQMKIIIGSIVLFAVAAVAPAADSDKKKADPNPGAATVPAVTIPNDAVPNSDGKTYAYTDKDGKKWVYTKTPFGVVKTPAVDRPAGARTDSNSTKAIDKGDTVRFERPSPFGTMSWEKKKSELTDDERHILDRQNAKTEQK